MLVQHTQLASTWLESGTTGNSSTLCCEWFNSIPSRAPAATEGGSSSIWDCALCVLRYAKWLGLFCPGSHSMPPSPFWQHASSFVQCHLPHPRHVCLVLPSNHALLLSPLLQPGRLPLLPWHSHKLTPPLDTPPPHTHTQLMCSSPAAPPLASPPASCGCSQVTLRAHPHPATR